MPDDRYVLTTARPTGGDPDLTSLRGWAIADAYARFRRLTGGDVLFAPGLGVTAGDTAAPSDLLGALGVAFDDDRLPALGDPAIERWAQWLLERLDGAGAIYQRADEGWRLRSGKAHEESERRLDELGGWNKAALAGQRKLLEHVDDPGDSGTDLEQSLSKLAAAGWSVDAKKDKGPPTIYYAAGDMPLVRGDDWRAAGALDPRFAAALAVLLAALPADRREDPSAGGSELPALLPALAIAGPDAAGALLDLRTLAKALRDAGGLELPDGEPLATVLVHAKLGVKAGPSANGSSPDAPGDDATAPAALVAAHGGDAVRFALLHAAAPAKRFHAGADVVGYAAAFLGRVRELAGARLDGSDPGDRIDTGDALRSRLAGWCDTAVARTAENYERLDMHRATRNAIVLATRIEDFDARAAERNGGELAGADREAVAVALTVLARLLAPLAPAAAGELWQRAGGDGSAREAGWPTAQREPAAA